MTAQEFADGIAQEAIANLNRARRSAAKKEHRQLRRRLYAAVLENHFSKEYKLRATTAQLKAGARTVADRILAGQDPRIVNSVPMTFSQTREGAAA